MITLKYVIKIVNPIADKLYITDDIKNQSTLSANVNSAGLTVTGEYFKNGRYFKASSQLLLGDEYYLNNNEELVLQDHTATTLDVESIFAIDGKKSYEIDPKILSNLNIFEQEAELVYKMKHVVESREDIIVFKISSDGTFTLTDCVVNGPSHLAQFHTPLYTSESYVYFVVGRTLQVGKGNNLHIPKKELHKLPEGFCTIRNKLVTKNSTRFINTQGSTVVQTAVAEDLVFSYPLSVDGIELTHYRTRPREMVLLDISNAILPLDKLEHYESNLTVIYKLLEDGSHVPELCLVTDLTEKLLEDYDVVYNTDINSLALLEADKEYKKKYVFVQYLIKVDTPSQTYSIENRQILLDLLNNIKKFSNKIVKI